MVGVGAQLGQYELIEKLASGGMASLYLARKRGAHGFERHAAVKVVHPHLADQETLGLMFVDEARCSSRIEHPNVVRIEDFGEVDGTTYLAMEYVHGCTLAELLEKLAQVGRRLDTAVAVSIAMQVAAGLHAAHRTTTAEGEPLEIVHRDVSPQNILLSYAGQVKLIDFGIAKARFRIAETKSVRIKGKLRYMAPEQLLMKNVDARTDVYALGLVLWECLAMRRYFDAPNDLAMIDQLRAPSPRPIGEHADVEDSLEEALLLALDPDISERHASARAFRKALRAACPDALELDPEDLADVLAQIMADELSIRTEALPEGIAKLPTKPLAEIEARARALTKPIELPEASWRDDTVETNVEIALPEEPAALASLPVAAPPASVAPIGPRPPSQRFAVGLVIVAGLLAFGATLVVMTSSDDPDEVAPPSTVVAPLPLIDTVAAAPEPEVDSRPQPEPPHEPLPERSIETEPEPPQVVEPAVLAPLRSPPELRRRVRNAEPRAPREQRPPLATRVSTAEAAARDCTMRGDNACVIRTLENGRARTPGALRMLIEAYRARGQTNTALRHMGTFVQRYPSHPSTRSYHQILSRH